MRKMLLFLVLGLTCMLSAHAEEDRVLMTIAGEPVMASEFMYIYEKNNQDNAVEKKTIDEYLDLFINFKLKVKEAEQQGIDTTAAFIKEFKGYRAQATPKYLKDQTAIDSLIRLSYERIAHDRRAAHIAVECRQGTPDSIEQAALNTILEARKLAVEGKGKNFFELASRFSTDPSVQENHGELGWISPFRYVYSFENAIYNTPVGEITEVFRSPYGFHIALVEEEQDHMEVRAQHIMKMVPRGNDSLDAVLKQEIDSIYALATIEGADFSELAKQHSDDKGSAVRGGELGWFARGYMVRPFEEAAFAMQDSGTISLPVRSAYGWHIIRLEGKRGIQPYESMREEIEKKMSRDERMKEAERSFIRKTRAEYHLGDEMTDAQVKEYADSHLEEKYPEFKNLVREYHDGILLFDVSLAEVWDKAGQDTLGLDKYFKAHRKNFKWDTPRFKGYIISCKDQASAKAAKNILKGAHPDSIDSYLNHRINIDSVAYVKFQHGMWTKGQNPAVDKFGFKDKKADYTPSEEYPIVFSAGSVLKSPEVWLDERGKVTTAYQDYLEAEWVKKLREKYPVVVDQQVFQSLKK